MSFHDAFELQAVNYALMCKAGFRKSEFALRLLIQLQVLHNLEISSKSVLLSCRCKCDKKYGATIFFTFDTDAATHFFD